MDDLKKALISFSLCMNHVEVLVGQMEMLIRHSGKEFENKGIRRTQFCEPEESPLEQEIYTYGGYWSYSPEYIIDQFTVFVPYRMRSSVLLTIFGMLEGEMDSVAALMLKKKEMPFSLNNFTEKGIHRSYLCIRKLLGIQHCQEWNDFMPIIKLRNIAAHNNKLMEKKDFVKENHLDQLISKNILLGTDGYGEAVSGFIFTGEGMFEIYHHMNKLLERIRKEVELKFY